MSEQVPLDEAIQFLARPESSLAAAGAGDSGNRSPIDVARPTATGLQWLAAPAACVGLAYRIQGSDGMTLEAISFGPKYQHDGAAVQVTQSLALSVPVVNMCCSADGRLIVLACMDGSLQCVDATSTSLSLRWSLAEAHSHVSSDVKQAVSSSRQWAACRAGPIHSFAFAPCGYAFLLADAGTQRLKIYNAAASQPPVNLIENLMTLQVLCACWSPIVTTDGNTTTTTTNDQYQFAAGTVNGNIGVYSISLLTGSTRKDATIPPPPDQDMQDFVPTHLDWFANHDVTTTTSLAAGYCRCSPHSDGDDDDEDDDADHDAVLYVGTIMGSSSSNQDYFVHATDLGEVVSFFSVPRNGRHVFFTCNSSTSAAGRKHSQGHANNNDSSMVLLCVASNVASDVGVVVRTAGASSADDTYSEWRTLDLQEGWGATCPTDEEDEFTFPTGIATIALPFLEDGANDASKTVEALLLASTDGSLSCFQLTNQNNSSDFCMPMEATSDALQGIAALPLMPVDSVNQALPSSTTPLPSEPQEQTSADSAPLEGVSQSSPPTPPLTSEPTAPDAQTTDAAAPVFGSGTSSGLTFGSGTATSLSIGTPAFGQTSALGVDATPFGSPAAAAGSTSAPLATPAFGSGSSVPVFGSSTSSFGGNFATLASSPAAKAATGFGSASPFGAFGKMSDAASSSSAGITSMSKPLFGDSTSCKPAEAVALKEAPHKEEAPKTEENDKDVARPSDKDETPPSDSSSTKAADAAVLKEASSLEKAPKKQGKGNDVARPFDKNETPPDAAQTTTKAPGASKAARVFDSFDKNKTGALPIDMLEGMMDELGEGMHGDEFDAQRALIDPEGTDTVERSAFIDWYVALLAGGGADDDNDTLDSGELEEWESSKKEAEEAFSSLATREEGDKLAIAPNDFGKLIAMLGTTYCEEEHKKTIAKLSKADGLIYEDDFIAWYRNWLFSLDDDLSDNEEEQADGDNGAQADGTSGWGTSEEADTWKCDVCMVRNAASATACGSCETPKPGVVAVPVEPARSAGPDGSSIGEGGFSFGGGSGQPGGFSFNSNVPPAGVTEPATGTSRPPGPSIGEGGFTFGSGSAGFSSETFKLENTSEHGKGNKNNEVTNEVAPLEKSEKMPTVGATSARGASKAARVFDSFDENKTGALPIEILEDMMDELGEGMYGDEFDAQRALIDPEGKGTVERSAFIDWYVALLAGGGADDDNDTLDSEELKEWEGSKKEAEEAFSSLATRGESDKLVIAADDFGKLIAMLGTTYCEEEHKKTISKLRKADGMIYKDDFIAWYRNWLFSLDDDLSDEEEERVDGDDAREADRAETGSTNEWGARLSSEDADTWKCDVCMVRNAASATACASCETPKPGVSAIPAEPTMGTDGSSIGEGGFSFGGGSGLPGGFSFGTNAASGPVPVATQAATVKSNLSGPSIGEGGFTFGSGSAGFTFGAFKIESASAEQKDVSRTPSEPTKSSESSSLPPVSTKAPTPLGVGNAAARAKAKSTGSSTYPPLSSKAPAPFLGVKLGSSEAKKSSGSSYPPIASKAPSSFGGGKSSASTQPKTSKSGGTSSFPPMPTKAPTPFSAAGNTSAPAATSSSGSPSYPPLSSKAPVAFGGVEPDSSEVKKPSGSSYPPISPTAPSPFGGDKSSVSNQSTKSGGTSSFPPMPTKAPTSFRAAAPAATNSSGSSSYPPLSSKAPAPFGGVKKKSSESSYPPISLQAPSPSGENVNASVKPKHKAYPPMSSEAPSSFNVMKASTESQPQPIPSKSAASSMYPPSSASAASPFSAAIKTSVRQKSGGPTAMPSNGSQLKSAVSDFPPLSSRAPVQSSGTTSSAYPPSKTSLPSDATKVHPQATTDALSSKAASLPEDSPWTNPASSDYETQFRKLIEKLETSSSLHANKRLSAEGGASLEREIENLAARNLSLIASCNDLSKHIGKERQRSVFLLSRKTDVERQITEARRLIDVQTRSAEAQARVMETQPLDAESERSRRSLAVKALMVKRSLDFLENRNSLLRGMCVLEDGGRHDSAIAIAQDDRKNILLEEMTSAFRRTQLFEEEVNRTSCRVFEYAESIPTIQSGMQSTPVSETRSYRKSLSGRKNRRRLTPVSLGSSRRNRPIRTSPEQSDGMGKWANIERAMCTTRVAPVSVKQLNRLARLGCALSVQGTTVNQRIATRKLGPSLLMSPTEGLPTSYAGKSTRQERLVFASPQNTARLEWNSGANADQEKMKGVSLAFPQRLKKIDAKEASRDALSGFGTTPEDTVRAMQLKKNARAENASASVAAAFPPMSSKAPTPFSTGRSSSKVNQAKTSSSYPPVANQAPKPLSSGTSTTESASSSSKVERVGSTKPSLSLQPKSAFPTLSLGSTIDEKGTETNSASAFGNLKGLSDSLFAEDKKSLSQTKSEQDVVGIREIGGTASATSTSSIPDYRQMLIEFYSKHNPAMLNEVDKTLEKYKGREVEMFDKLARKYSVASPLGSTGTEASSSRTLQTPASSLTSPVAPMPASSTGPGSVFGSSASSGFQTASPSVTSSPSPFGASAAPSNPSPFGQTASGPGTSSAFGSAPSLSPFGSAVPSSPSPFGQPTAAPPTAAPPPTASCLIGGREPREVLIAFYQKYNPTKLNEVEKVLLKYRGNEEQLFRNLAKRYNLDPSIFGMPSNAPAASSFGQSGGFGQIAQSFGGSSTPSFGQASSLGTSQTSSTFASPSASGGHAFGSSSAIGGGQSTFGSLTQPGTQQTTPFGGGIQQAGGFGSLSGNVGGFGGAGGAFGSGGAAPSNPFGAPRR